MRTFADLSATEVESIARTLGAGHYYLLTGAGVSLDSVGSKGKLESVGDLKKRLCINAGISDNSSLQQAYSLISDDELLINNELTNFYVCQEPGKTVLDIINTPWRRIFTFNIDNTCEVAIRQQITELGIHNTPFESFHFNDDWKDVNPSIIHSLVHLHGFVECSERGYVFSHNEYAKSLTKANSWMSALTQLMRSEPFVVAGTTLEEVDVSFYLEQRPNFVDFIENETPSILIEPYPTKLTERLCDKHSFILYQGFFSDFLKDLKSFAEIISPFELDGSVSSIKSTATEQKKSIFLNSFKPVPVYPEVDNNPRRFLLGATVSWKMLAANADIRRDNAFELGAIIIDNMREGIPFNIILDHPAS